MKNLLTKQDQIKLTKGIENLKKEKEDIHLDNKIRNHEEKNKRLSQKYNDALKHIEVLEKKVEVVSDIKEYVPRLFQIKPKLSSATSEATSVMVMSDWHLEEKVDLALVNNLNEYNVEIARQRAIKFFQGGLRLTEIQRSGVKIPNLILAILGDMISGYIHEELEENNLLTPIEAIMVAEDMIVSGIDFLLKNGKFEKIIVICKVGNHARTTKKKRFSTGYKNNYEWLLFNHLAKYFIKEKRIEFIIPPSYFYTYYIYDFPIRFHHGDSIKYQGGVGGITISANKAIAQWNKSSEAYLDIFGHYHFYQSPEGFVCNGSGIGYNSFALEGKFAFQKPVQAWLLLDKKRGRTISGPIYLD